MKYYELINIYWNQTALNSIMNIFSNAGLCPWRYIKKIAGISRFLMFVTKYGR
jgi:hypothetical protein